MKGHCFRLASLGFAVLLAQAVGAQDTSAPAQGVPRCYRLLRGEWSRPLGVNAQYHALPSIIRLDTTRAVRGGWTVVPDIAYPTKSRFPDLPHWTRQADSLEIRWSDGFQATIVRLPKGEGGELRGTATVWSDAHEFRRNPPHASILARPVSCAEVP
jgi:hypothetical protein